MSLSEYLGLEPIDETTGAVVVTAPACSSYGALFGGCAMAFAIDTARRATGRPLVWASAQFVSQAWPGERLVFRTTVVASGRSNTQVRVVGSTGEGDAAREVVVVLAALGRREHPQSSTFVSPPEVGPPSQYVDRPRQWPDRDSVETWLSQRLALGRSPAEPGPRSTDGRSAIWMHVPDALDADAGLLAVLGDFVPFGALQTVEMPIGVTSIDNALRIVDLVPTRWVLADIRIHAVHHGFAHGDTFLWSESGTLLAVASQTTQLRPVPSGRRPGG